MANDEGTTDLYSALVRLCQAHGTTTDATYGLLRNVVNSVIRKNVHVVGIDTGVPTFSVTYTVDVDGVIYTVEQASDERASGEDWYRDGRPDYPFSDDQEWQPEQDDAKVQQFWSRYREAVDAIHRDLFDDLDAGSSA